MMARCGGTDSHGGHVFAESHGWRTGRPTFCAGNRDIVEAIDATAERIDVRGRAYTFGDLAERTREDDAR